LSPEHYIFNEENSEFIIHKDALEAFGISNGVLCTHAMISEEDMTKLLGISKDEAKTEMQVLYDKGLIERTYNKGVFTIVRDSLKELIKNLSYYAPLERPKRRTSISADIVPEKKVAVKKEDSKKIETKKKDLEKKIKEEKTKEETTLPKAYEEQIEKLTNEFVDKAIEFAEERGVDFNETYLIKEAAKFRRLDYKKSKDPTNQAHNSLYLAIKNNSIKDVKFEGSDKTKISGLDVVIYSLSMKAKKEYKDKNYTELALQKPFNNPKQLCKAVSTKAKEILKERIEAGEIVFTPTEIKEKIEKETEDKPKSKKEEQIEELTDNLVKRINEFAEEKGIDFEEQYTINEAAVLIRDDYDTNALAYARVYGGLSAAKKVGEFKFENADSKISGLDFISYYLGQETKTSYTKQDIVKSGRVKPFFSAKQLYEVTSTKARERILGKDEEEIEETEIEEKIETEEIKTPRKTKEKKKTTRLKIDQTARLKKIKADEAELIDKLSNNFAQKINTFAEERKINLKKEYHIEDLAEFVKSDYGDYSKAYEALYKAAERNGFNGAVEFKLEATQISGLDFIIFNSKNDVRKAHRDQKIVGLDKEYPFHSLDATYEEVSKEAKRKIVEGVEIKELIEEEIVVEQEIEKPKPEIKEEEPEKPKEYLETLVDELIRDVKSFAKERMVELETEYSINEATGISGETYREIYDEVKSHDVFGTVKFDDVDTRIPGFAVALLSVAEGVKEYYTEQGIVQLDGKGKIPYKSLRKAYKVIARRAGKKIAEELNKPCEIICDYVSFNEGFLATKKGISKNSLSKKISSFPEEKRAFNNEQKTYLLHKDIIKYLKVDVEKYDYVRISLQKLLEMTGKDEKTVRNEVGQIFNKNLSFTTEERTSFYIKKDDLVEIFHDLNYNKSINFRSAGEAASQKEGDQPP